MHWALAHCQGYVMHLLIASSFICAAEVIANSLTRKMQQVLLQLCLPQKGARCTPVASGLVAKLGSSSFWPAYKFLLCMFHSFICLF